VVLHDVARPQESSDVRLRSDGIDNGGGLVKYDGEVAWCVVRGDKRSTELDHIVERAIQGVVFHVIAISPNSVVCAVDGLGSIHIQIIGAHTTREAGTSGIGKVLTASEEIMRVAAVPYVHVSDHCIADNHATGAGNTECAPSHVSGSGQT